MDTDDILGLLQETAETVITPRFRALEDGDVDQKQGPNDLVTVADREAETFVAERLKKRYPRSLILGEEAAFADPDLVAKLPHADHAFVIDPIDGTNNFVRGDIKHGIMLAEVEGGITTRGWIWQPQTGRAYVAERGAGVRRNGEAIIRQAPDRLPLGGTSRQEFQGFDGDGTLSPVTWSMFSAAFDYPAVLEGDLDFLYYRTTYPWDHLPGALMLGESGGVSRTFDGVSYSALSKRSPLISAANVDVWMAAQLSWPINRP